MAQDAHQLFREDLEGSSHVQSKKGKIMFWFIDAGKIRIAGDTSLVFIDMCTLWMRVRIHNTKTCLCNVNKINQPAPRVQREDEKLRAEEMFQLARRSLYAMLAHQDSCKTVIIPSSLPYAMKSAD